MFSTTFATPDPDATGLTDLTKSDLDGALVVFTLRKVDHDFPTKLGTTTAATVDLLVVDGKHAGTELPDWLAFGNLGRQLGAIPVGETGLGRIVSGDSKYGTKWYGCDYEVTADDVKAASAAVEGRAAAEPANAVVDEPATRDGFDF